MELKIFLIDHSVRISLYIYICLICIVYFGEFVFSYLLFFSHGPYCSSSVFITYFGISGDQVHLIIELNFYKSKSSYLYFANIIINNNCHHIRMYLWNSTYLMSFGTNNQKFEIKIEEHGIKKIQKN